MKNRYLILLTTLTFFGYSVAAPAHDCSRHQDQNHKHCGGGGAISYTAKLIAGAFTFDVEADPYSKENGLRNGGDLDMIHPDDGGVLEATWNQVFNTCTELLAWDSVESIFVANDSWTIERAGGVRVILRDIVLPLKDTDETQEVEVRVQLIGNEFDFDDSNPFLPEPGSAIEYELTQFAISGSTVKGVHPRSGCQPSGGGGFDIFDLIPHSTLVITATGQ